MVINEVLEWYPPGGRRRRRKGRKGNTSKFVDTGNNDWDEGINSIEWINKEELRRKIKLWNLWQPTTLKYLGSYFVIGKFLYRKLMMVGRLDVANNPPPLNLLDDGSSLFADKARVSWQ